MFSAPVSHGKVSGSNPGGVASFTHPAVEMGPQLILVLGKKKMSPGMMLPTLCAGASPRVVLETPLAPAITLTK